MNNFERLLKSIDALLKEESEELKSELTAFDGAETLADLVEEFEEGLAKLFEQQREHYINGFNSAIEKDGGIDLKSLFERLIAADEFGDEMTSFTESKALHKEYYRRRNLKRIGAAPA